MDGAEYLDQREDKKKRSGDHRLEIHDCCVFYGDAQALKNISLTVNIKEVVSILGSNGAGKTTLLKTVTGFLPIRIGNIIFQNESIKGKRPYKIVRKGIGHVPEGRELFGSMTVSDNLLLGTYPLKRKERKKLQTVRLEMVFSLFPVLKERANQKTETLSGGEQQMVAIGRALMSNPRLVALDEPSLGLSPLLVTEMMRLLKQICGKWEVSILLVEQNARAALKIADYVYVFERGEVILDGKPQELIESPTIKSAYLGG